MLKKRIIPKLLLKHEKFQDSYNPIFVTSKKFSKINLVGDPISQGKIFEAQLADELVLLNFERLIIKNNKPYYEFLKKFSSNIFLPLTIGGGIKDISDIEMHLKSGADKIIINTQAVLDKSLINKASKIFGKQCIVVSIDFMKTENNKNIVFIDRGRVRTELDVVSWAKEVQDLGAGEIILTDIDRDGSKKGLNIDVGNQISQSLNIPIILNGGCGLSNHFVEGFKKTKAQGIAAGTFFAHKDQNFFEARSQVLNSNIQLR
jgi:imidazole glycerol-phosphate synthase subunit HisF